MPLKDTNRLSVRRLYNSSESRSKYVSIDS